MKNIKKLILVLPLLTVTGCNNLKSYSEFIAKMTEKESAELYVEKDSDYDFNAKFKISPQGVVVYCTLNSGDYYALVNWTLKDQESVPESYPFTIDYGMSEASTKQATFTLPNTFTTKTTITFDTCPDDPSSVEEKVRDVVISLVVALNYYTLTNYTTSLITLGIFPNFEYSSLLVKK